MYKIRRNQFRIYPDLKPSTLWQHTTTTLVARKPAFCVSGLLGLLSQGDNGSQWLTFSGLGTRELKLALQQNILLFRLHECSFDMRMSESSFLITRPMSQQQIYDAYDGIQEQITEVGVLQPENQWSCKRSLGIWSGHTYI